MRRWASVGHWPQQVFHGDDDANVLLISPRRSLRLHDPTAIDQLNDELKRELVAAMEVVPHLVKTETDRINFLRREGFDPAEAAHRLATYWKQRKQVFKSRWLLPMSQTGSGTLTKNAIEILQSGFIALISSPSPVCLVDISRLPRPLEDEMAACMFYLGTIGSDKESQTNGMTIIHLVSGEARHQNLNLESLTWTVIHDALPFRIKDILILPLYEPGKEHLIEYLAFQTSSLVNFRSGRQSIILQHKYGTAGMLDLLEKRGISRQVLPRHLGGSFDDLSFHLWIQNRLKIENAALSPTPSNTRDYTPRGSTSLLVKRKKTKDEEAEKEFVRKRNALYARRMYYKKKMELIALPEQREALLAQNAALRQDNHHLSALLNDAEQILSAHGLVHETQVNNHDNGMDSVRAPSQSPPIWMSHPIHLPPDPPSRPIEAAASLERVGSFSLLFESYDIELPPEG